MVYQRTASSSFFEERRNQLHLRVNTSQGNSLQTFKNLDIATEDNEDEEIQTTQLREKYYDTATHPYYDTPKVSQYHHVKPLVLFSLDITHWSPILQYIFLVGGLILFMCLYGYYQELVIYGWFNRKLSLFSTFLHFLGCTAFAQLQRNLSTPSNNSEIVSQSNNSPTKPAPTTGILRKIFYYLSIYTKSWSNISMGTASSQIAITYYILLVVTKTAAQGLSNLSMSEINYPAKVLFKSANPIVTIFLGLFWFRKTYPLRDYIVVALLILGLYVFITGDVNGKGGQPECTPLGIFYVILSMFGSALGPMIQEYCIQTYNASIEDLLYYSFLGSTIVSLGLSIINGEFIQGLSFLLHSSSIHIWFIFISFCTFGFVGANFSTAITAHYGSLVNGLSNTLRKAVTMCVSFFMFPERNELTHRKIFGAMIFFAGLLVSTFWGGEEKEHHHSRHKKHSLPMEPQLQQQQLSKPTRFIEENDQHSKLSLNDLERGGGGSSEVGLRLGLSGVEEDVRTNYSGESYQSESDSEKLPKSNQNILLSSNQRIQLDVPPPNYESLLPPQPSSSMTTIGGGVLPSAPLPSPYSNGSQPSASNQASTFSSPIQQRAPMLMTNNNSLSSPNRQQQQQPSFFPPANPQGLLSPQKPSEMIKRFPSPAPPTVNLTTPGHSSLPAFSAPSNPNHNPSHPATYQQINNNYQSNYNNNENNNHHHAHNQKEKSVYNSVYHNLSAFYNNLSNGSDPQLPQSSREDEQDYDDEDDDDDDDEESEERRRNRYKKYQITV